jgi:hypothetical protein
VDPSRLDRFLAFGLPSFIRGLGLQKPLVLLLRLSGHRDVAQSNSSRRAILGARGRGFSHYPLDYLPRLLVRALTALERRHHRWKQVRVELDPPPSLRLLGRDSGCHAPGDVRADERAGYPDERQHDQLQEGERLRGVGQCPQRLTEHLFRAAMVADLPIPELVENRRRSIAMLPSGAPVLNRDEALQLLEQLKAALGELRRLQRDAQTD